MRKYLTIHNGSGSVIVGRSFTETNTLRIKSVSAKKLYHCTYGRQAWRKYTQNSFYTALDVAKAYCEDSRSRGKTFYIKELPAIQIETGGIVFFITQLNTQSPLKSFIPSLLKKSGEVESLGKRSCLGFGISMNVLIDALERDSEYWQEKPGENQTIICFSEEADTVANNLDTKELNEWSSLSRGAKYDLTWIEGESDVRSQFVMKLIEEYGFDNYGANNVSFLGEVNNTKGLILRQARKAGYQNLISYFNSDEYEVIFDNYDNLFTLREYFVYIEKNNELFGYVTDLIIAQLNSGVLRPKIPDRLNELFREEVLPVYGKLKKMARDKGD